MKIFSIFVGFMWSKRSKCDTNAPDLVDRSHPGFVYAPGDGNLYLDGKLFNFRNFNAPTIFEGGEYQGRDILKSVAAFGNPVTRTYTLQISNDALQFGKLPASSGHVTGWDKNSNDWIYNESQWRKMDQMLDLSRHYGVKLIIPIINQDYGNPESNYIGDFNDLIRHRYGIYGYKDAGNRIDFFKDRIMIDSFKKLITFFLERVNTYNGIRYGDDNTILAFETGNEMSWGQFANLSAGPAPGLLRFPGTSKRWHQNFSDGWKLVTGFFIARVIQKSPGNKRHLNLHMWIYFLITSMAAETRRHSTCSTTRFVPLERLWLLGNTVSIPMCVSGVRRATPSSGLSLLRSRFPDRPDVFIVTNGSHPGLSWRGEARAAGYEIFGAEAWGREFNLISDIIPDNVEAGGIFIPLNPQRPSELLNMKPRNRNQMNLTMVGRIGSGAGNEAYWAVTVWKNCPTGWVEMFWETWLDKIP
ncbi:hypothetical protein Pst134EA_002797 [Puccinia striiformis f. sp. tritici]|uniref:hypothetical protein n=1 Tax=Puccinia striiformis f. sp. tritici TaxID=168172 RepID=UPI002008303D|nr:hypothetical protein Pst134EA_002797 [Puccinia striiformis f. sp. tritici]KAH9472172.1 hypothetical protein Pst134EA_002797 [Puccinia striiformis f. sp. tritici]